MHDMGGVLIEGSAVTHGFRGTRRAAVIVAAALAVTFATTGSGNAAPTQSGPAPGIGSALAETSKIDPRAAGLSLGITAGRALAGHQNSVAQAASQAMDYGVIGSTLAGEGCDGSDPTLAADEQPQPLQVDSREEGASEFKTESEGNFPGGSASFTKQARATTAPLAEAITTTAPFGIAGVMEVGGGVAHSTSGLVDGIRTATATVDISGIKLAGQIAFENLHWEASYPSTGGGQPSGSFSIGRMTAAGQALPTSNPIEALAGLNAVLGNVGILIQPPQVRAASGRMYVDPMRISVVPNPTRDALFNNVLVGVQPTRESLFDALLKQDCGNATYITIFDIALGSITGAGEFNLLLGGVQATSGESLVNSFTLGGNNFSLGNSGTLTGTIGSTDTTGGTTGAVGGAKTTTGTPSVGQTAAGAAPSTNTQPAASTKLAGERGGALAGVGLAGLLLLAAAAEADRRKMRAAQRAIVYDD